MLLFVVEKPLKNPLLANLTALKMQVKIVKN